MEAPTCARSSGMELLILCSAFLFLRGAAVDVTSETGEDVTLVCGLGEDYPEWLDPDGNVLTANNVVTPPDMEYVDNKQDLRITNVKTSHAGDYTCRGTNNVENTVTLIVNSFDYAVSFSDVYKESISPNYIPVPRRKNLTLTCTVENAFPVPQVALGFVAPNTLEVDDVTVVSAEQQADNTFTVVVSGMILWSKEVDLKTVSCKATSGDRSVEATEQLKVVNPPNVRSYTGSNNQFADSRIGDEFICTVELVYPTVQFRWFVNDSSTDLPPEFTRPAPGRCSPVLAPEGYVRRTLYTCETQLNFTGLPKEYNGMEVYCGVIYMGEQYLTYQSRWTLSILFSPTSATILEPAETIEAVEGETITMKCMTDAAYGGKKLNTSGVAFKWLINYMEMTSSSDDIMEISHVEEPGPGGVGFTATQTVQFPATRDMNGDSLTCRASSSFTSAYVYDSRTLKIAYPPILSQPARSEYYAYYHTRVEIPCLADSNPASTINWYRVHDDGNSSDVAELNEASQTGNLLVLKMSPDNLHLPGGVYRCVADNGIGQMASRDTQLIVGERPRRPRYVVSREDATSFTVKITMPAPDGILAYVYVQYRWIGESSDMWRNDIMWSEANMRFPDADYDATNTVYSLTVTGCQPSAHYETRLKIVDSDGRTFYTLNTLRAKTKETSGEGLKTWSQYRGAILICVFVTFGVMLIILIVTVVLMKRGVCNKQSSMTVSSETAGSYGRHQGGKTDGVDMVAMHNR